MNPLQQPFKFPKWLWLGISAVIFFYLLFAVRIGYSAKWPENFTAWKALVGGYEDYSISIGVDACLVWLVCAFVLGAFVAVLVGALRQLLWKTK